jgi:hypothetical protein
MPITISGDSPNFTSATLTTPTLTSPTFAGTPSGSIITSGTVNGGAANPLSGGTSVDFTGIPSWVKRVTVNFNGLSTNGTSLVQIQIGAGSITTSGYASNAAYVSNNTCLNNGIYTSSFVILNSVIASYTYNGSIVLTLLGSNIWCESGQMGLLSGGNANFFSVGSITLGGTLDRVRITTANGTDTFDAGSINILYE